MTCVKFLQSTVIFESLQITSVIGHDNPAVEGSKVVCLSLSIMPKGPKGQKRPADVIGNAVHVMRIATGEIADTPHSTDNGKNKAAVELGRKGGLARAKSISKTRRAEIARRAATSRWRKP